tara:strand:+ start:5108 stop:6007 length:900 start_codon:yes stop_codon:yes gene_type:complete
MRKRFLLILTAFFLITLSLTEGEKGEKEPIHKDPIVMPLVDDPLAVSTNIAPVEQRGIEYRKWISKGVKVSSQGSSGSGTIIYYDRSTGWAYVQSCGHLWGGDMSAKEGLRKKKTAKIITWYHNNKKLNASRSYPAEVLFYDTHNDPDISLLRFKPDWPTEFFPIAPHDYVIQEGAKAHSIGCDGGREVAHYAVEIVGERNGTWKDLVTANNSPRPGRSGGGLISDDGYFIGICWGTSDYDGSGNGYFTALSEIHKIMERENYGWLLRVSLSLAREIPIVDRNNLQGSYPRDYIAVPNQ